MAPKCYLSPGPPNLAAPHDSRAPGTMGGMDQDDLYGLPLDRFVPERSALARALRADGRRDEAAAVAALRKPSVAAWAVNQLVRSQRAAVKALLDSGDALREAQADLLAGRGDGRALRAAGERQRAAVDGLADAARGLLTSEGRELSPAVVERIVDTLHAAALDEDARAQLRAGRLERELRHVGLGLGEAPATVAPSPASGAGAKRDPATEDPQPRPQRSERQGDARQRAAAAEHAARERAAARKAARAVELAARRRAERAARALRAAEERRAGAARVLDEADEALAAARAEADDAADAQRRARADLESL